jgi:glycosyltransferase involved in cell wall biosynthesis
LSGTLGVAAGAVGRRGARQVAGRVRGVRRQLAAAAPGRSPAVAGPAPRSLSQVGRAGDVLAVLGSPWFHTEYAALAARLRGLHGLRLAVLMHDAIPALHPEWCDRGTTRVFRHWYGTVLPLADLVFSNSRATAADVSRWCDGTGITLAGPVQPLPVGTGFGVAEAPREVSARLPGLERPYVLFVSTIEARKNHALLLQVWRRLIEEMPADRVPDLVFAGRVGWMVSDLMDQIGNSRNLDGRLHLLQGLDDAALRAAYEGCLFTVFPSLSEGWGLPVTESLALGKPCVASSATAIPEAGGALARYFDPTSLSAATRAIREAIEDEAGLRTWQEQVRREFRPVSWAETGRALLAAVDAAAPI